MKTATLFLTCIILFAGGIANAFSTCPMNMEKAYSQMQMDGDMDIPCHNTEDSQGQNSEQCDDCNCQHCAKTNALPAQGLKDHYGEVTIAIQPGELLPSRQVKTPFQPPEHLS